MAIGTQSDFSMHSGDTRTLEITVKDEDSAVVNISTATITWALSKQDSASVAPKGAAIVTKTVGDGVTITDGPNGRVDVAISAADTSALSGDYYHELEVTISSSVSTVLFGTVTIKKDLI
jgi:hypothetical protein